MAVSSPHPSEADTPTPLSTSPFTEIGALLGQSFADELTQVKAILTGAIPTMDDQRSTWLREVIDYSLSTPGKLLRPLLCLMVSQATASNHQPLSKHHLTTAAVAEMIHIATLLHDDVLDDADTRRGKPTARLQWNNTVAILGGDYLLAQASRRLAQIGNIRLVAIYSDVLADLCDGEIEQLRTQRNLNLDWDSYHTKTRCKTASLFAAVCESAGVLNQLEEATIQHLRQFGESVGQAFQLVDDLLDFQSSEAVTGKPVLNDLRQGLITAPILLAFESEHLPESAKTQLYTTIEQVFNNQDIEANLATIQTLLNQAKAYTATQTLANSLVDQALDNLHKAIPDAKQRQPLETLASLLVNRQQ